MKIVKKILKYLAYSLLSILVIFSIYSVIMVKVLNKDYVNVFGYTYFVVASGSMSGTIEVNDIIIVKLNDGYKEKDIVTFKNNGSFITHRVERIEKDKVITRGDANNLDDDPVSKKDIIGRVVLIVSTAALLKILIVGVFIALIIVIIYFDKIFKKYITKEKKTKDLKTPLEYTQKIKLSKDKNKNIPLLEKNNDEIEVLELDDEKEFLNLVLKVLKSKNKNLMLTKQGSLKLKYVYEIAVASLYDQEEINKLLKDVPFKELYDYEFEDILFTKNIQDKLYEMPMYIYLKLLSYSLLYDENEYFDAIFKMLKYRIKIDREEKFIKNNKRMTEVMALIEKIIINVGHEEDFELKQIKERIKANREIKNLEILHRTRMLPKICPNCCGKIPKGTITHCPHCGKQLMIK